MARKRTATAARPTARDVDAALGRDDFAKAVAVAGQMAEASPTPEGRAYYFKILGLAAEGFTRMGKAKAAVETLRTAERFAELHPEHAVDAAIIHAKAGEFVTALRLATEPRVLRHVADFCVRKNRADGGPPEVTAGLPLIQRAFREYESGQDEQAKESLQQIGLTSPFLEWKVLLRGLMSYAANDDARAVENWQRLNPENLPAALAAPLRAAIDPAFVAAQPAATAAAVRERSDHLVAGGLLAGLRQIQKHVGRDQPLQPVWKHVEKVVPALREFPQLLPRLGVVLYEAIIRQGEPTDLKKYRTLFPAPADDPQFHRLEALACEAIRSPAAAVEHWEKYERWLAARPVGWPEPLANRARAKILHRVGQMLEDDQHDRAEQTDFERAMFELLGKAPKKRVANRDPHDFYRRSLALAPDWPEPAYDLFDSLTESNAPTKAMAVAEELLKKRPADLPMLQRLADLQRSVGKHAEALATYKAALAANPLDPTLAAAVELAAVAAIRQRLLAEEYDACDKLFAEMAAFPSSRFGLYVASLYVVYLRKLGRTADAAAAEAKLLEHKMQLAVAFVLSVDGLLAKLKPAQRKAADARLKAALETPTPPPVQVAVLYTAWALYQTEGLKYRGQPAHEKKVLALAERSLLSAEATARDFAMLLSLVEQREHFKVLQKLAASLSARFPRGPAFPFFEAKAVINTGKSYASGHRVRHLLDTAKALAEASPEAEDKKLLDLIDPARREVIAALDPFRHPLFGGRDDFDDF